MKDTGGEPHFRTYLQNELIRRCRENSHYSLRSFARALQIEPSVLSKILRGKRQITQKMFSQLAKKMGLSATEMQHYAPSRSIRRHHLGTAPYRDLPLTLFDSISDWYHFAILELMATPHVQYDPKWIANQLGLRLPQVSIAIERLVRAGLIEVDVQGRWHDRSGALSSSRMTRTSASLRKLQRQVLEKSLLALNEIPIEERDHSSMCMAIDSKKLPEAREKIKKFRRELCEFLKGDGPPRDRVYHLAVSLYPVTKKQDAIKKRRSNHEN